MARTTVDPGMMYDGPVAPSPPAGEEKTLNDCTTHHHLFMHHWYK